MTEKRQTVMQVARGLYGSAFDARSKGERGKSIQDWLELSEGERSYAMAHLLYLNLESQVVTQGLLREIRDTLEDTEEAVQDIADEVLAPDSESPDEVDLPEPEGAAIDEGPSPESPPGPEPQPKQPEVSEEAREPVQEEEPRHE